MSDNELSIQEQCNENPMFAEEPKQEQKVQNTWVKSSKDLIDKYKNKFDAFKAMADQAGCIEQNKFLVGNEGRTEIFKKMDADGDGKITSEEWNSGWKNLDLQYLEDQHKVSLAQQKQEILDALDLKVESGQKFHENGQKFQESGQKFFDIGSKFQESGQKFYEAAPKEQKVQESGPKFQEQKFYESIQKFSESSQKFYESSQKFNDSNSQLPTEQPGPINNLLDQFKSATTLDDLSDLFNKRSPFKERNNYQEEQKQVNYEIDFKPKKVEKNQENILQQFRTPNKIDYELLFENSAPTKQVGTYLNPQPQNLKPQLSRSPNARFGFIQASPSSQFVGSSKKKENSQNTFLTTKVQQTMNFSVEVKEQFKQSKRKEELNHFMGKLGIGKYEAPKVTINLDAGGQYAFEKLKHYVNNIGNSNTKKAPCPGLGELVNDKSFNTCTFKQQVKAHKKEKGSESTQRMSVDNPMLQDQSFKSLHLKSVHQQRASSFMGRQMRV